MSGCGCNTITLPVGPAGANGTNGTNGNGISTIAWTSNSNGDPQGTEGTTDTYTITYTDATTSTFVITNGADGLDGMIMFQNTSVSSPVTIGNAYTDVVFSNAPITIPANTLVNVGDMLRIEIAFQNDVADISSYVGFLAQIKFAGSQVLERTVGSKNTSDLFNGATFSFDLIVTATNTLSSRVNSAVPTLGDRALQYSFSTVSGGLNSLMSVPAFNASGTAISPTTPTLTNSNAITVQLKNTSGVSTDLASVTSILVTRFRKYQ